MPAVTRGPGLLILLAGLALAAQPTAAGGGSLALVGATLIDGSRAAPVGNATLVIADGRIQAAGPGSETPIPEGAERMALAGKWIIPGLIDAHVHFFQSASLYARPDVIDLRGLRPYADEAAWVRRNLDDTLARYLASGVSAVVDMGGPGWVYEVRRRAREAGRAPRVAVAGHLLAPFSPPALEIEDPPIRAVGSPDEARLLVRRELERDADLIKLWLVGMPPEEIRRPDGWVRAAVDTAHQGGVRVAVHATELERARAAVEAGADILAHSVDDAPVDEAFVDLLRERGVLYVATLMVKAGYREVLGQRVRLSAIERRLGDPRVIGTWTDLARIRPGGRASRPLRDADPTALRNLRRLHDAGVALAAGSDAGNIGTLHGPALHRELELMARSGVSAREVLLAATRGGARVMGRDDLGTLAPGARADLVVLDANPLEDIRNTRRIRLVVKGGVPWRPSTLLPDSPPPHPWDQQSPGQGGMIPAAGAVTIAARRNPVPQRPVETVVDDERHHGRAPERHRAD
jgi:imidazolonepropionase-like amidohydrolase